MEKPMRALALAAAVAASTLAGAGEARAERCWMVTYVAGNVFASAEVIKRGDNSGQMLSYEEIVSIVTNDAVKNGFPGTATSTGVFEVTCPKRRDR